MRKTLIIVLIGLLPFRAYLPLPETKEAAAEISKMEPLSIGDNTNIHYTGLYCDACHDGTPVKGGDIYLKYNGDDQLLCRCHHGMSPGYCHPLDINPNKVERGKIPAEFPFENAKFTCNTCHDIYRQCQKSLFDRKSLRGIPYPQKTDFCYKCHDRKNYEKLNAHHQIRSDGNLDKKMCLYCHKEKPDERTATYKEVTFIGDIKILCRRCHQIEGNHAGNFDHMAAKPSAKGIKRMDALIEKYNIILPLAKDGKMTCITCHNPHAKGVIAADKPSAMGADSKFRHRLPGKLCKECHQL
jgi:hypothetical protein